MKEKTVFLMNPSTRNMVINQKTVDYFACLGEVMFNEGGTDAASIKNVIKDATIAVTSWGNNPIDGEILAECPNLKFLAHAAGSVKPVVSDELWAKGIRVLSSACPLGEGVAETALGFTISASKNFYNLNTNVKNGLWNEGKENIRELFDLKVGVIGAGWAGKHYIKLMKNFYVDVLVSDPFLPAEAAAAMGAQKAELEEVLSQCDIISIHAPSIPSTNHMFNEKTLGMMKKDAILINTARGTIIDEKALYEHMKSGNLKYACLDVFDPEPPAADNPLLTLPNVIVTPHLAGLANNGLRRIGTFITEEFENYRNGKAFRGEVTREMLAVMA